MKKGCGALKIVLTGGPCGGKTTALPIIKKHLEEKGYRAIIIAETATELINGGLAPSTMKTVESYQRHLTMLQLEKERIIMNATKEMRGQGRAVVICDRGILDNKAYIDDATFSSILVSLGQDEEKLAQSYDAVFHLVTAANGAKESYSLSGNSARTETPNRAIELDNRVLEAWKNHKKRYVIDNESVFGFEQKIDMLISCLDELLENESRAC